MWRSGAGMWVARPYVKSPPRGDVVGFVRRALARAVAAIVHLKPLPCVLGEGASVVPLLKPVGDNGAENPARRTLLTRA